MRFIAWLQQQWYKPDLTIVSICLLPLSFLFGFVVSLRRSFYRIGWLKQVNFSKPVIVVGNITVGGTGKTPMVIYLVEVLKKNGFHPGVVARGAGGKKQLAVAEVFSNSDPFKFGDETVLIAKRTKCPVRVSVDRAAAVSAIFSETNCDVVISDDGLQHYRMGRTLEIILTDGLHGLGNGALLPAGPLRENPARLAKAAAVWAKGVDFTYDCQDLYSLSVKTKTKSLHSFAGRTVHAVAGIANPELFFSMLTNHGISVIKHVFPDHHRFIASDVNFEDDLSVIMTEKDAIKCADFANVDCWCLPINVVPSQEMSNKLEAMLCDL